MMQALEDIKKAGCNALCVYLGNFGPEIAETMLAKYFDGPKMFMAASEETSADGGLVGGRGDAFCGMLNASYNLYKSTILQKYYKHIIFALHFLHFIVFP